MRKAAVIGLPAALATLVLATVVATALLTHLAWSVAARRNVEDVAGQLNRQIVGSIRHELRSILDDAWSVQEALRSIFEQEAIRPTDEGKREFISLALLRSHATLSWIALGLPDGGFFGALHADDNEIDMIGVGPDPDTGAWRQRVDRYNPEPDDIRFLERLLTPSQFDARGQEWYRRAVSEDGPGWSLLTPLPGRDRPGIITSTPLTIDRRFAGVIAVVVEMERLSRFIAGMPVGATGTAMVMDRAGTVIASGEPAVLASQQRGETLTVAMLAAINPHLALVGRAATGIDTDQGLTATRQSELTDPADGQRYFVTLTPLDFRGWVIATVIPASDFLASVDRTASMLLAALVLLTLLLAAAGIITAHRLVALPLLRIAAQLDHIRAFRLDQVSQPRSALREIDALSAAIMAMSRGLASFRRYMPADLVRTLLDRGIEARPGGSRETLTVMFTDLAGFTALSEQLGEQVVPVLADHLETCSTAILARRGTIDKFVGDAVMAFWGAPLANSSHAADACAAALACQAAMAAQRAGAAADGRPVLHMRIGLNTGRMLVGNVGAPERLSYTVIGDPVNVASRLESLNKLYGTAILIGDDTRQAAGTAFLCRRLDRVAVYGRREGLVIHELLDLADGAAPPPWVALYETALEAYERHDWDDAITGFTAARAARGGIDRPSDLLIERCRRFRSEPPAAGAPVLALTEK